MKQNLISILISNYNKEKFLQKSLKSITKQNYNNYEIILFDDYSNDNSLKIIKKFRNVKLLRNKKRSNKSAPLNQINGLINAFKKSKGSIICLMDSDDFFKKNKLKEINKNFQNKKIKSIFNLPKANEKQFIFKKKKSSSIWPTIFPTSCISVTKNIFIKFERYIQKNEFPNLEIDARLTIFLNFFCEEYNVLKKELTIYNYDYNGITAKIKRFSIKWWLRRFEAFQYLKYIQRVKGKVFKKSIDYFITILVTFIIIKLNLK